jgi:transmembrane sensor
MDDQRHNEVMEEDLFDRYLSGTASENEIRQLRELSGTSVILKEKLEEYDKIIRQMEALELMRRVDTSSAFIRLKKRLGQYQTKRGWFFYWQKAAAVLLLPIILFSIFQFLVQKKILLSESSSKPEYNEISTSSGLRSTFKLPDGTKVWLNGSTRIKYPVFFSGNERRIRLEGEAYFEVAENPDMPFIVDLGALRVQAVGTAFNCMAYPGDTLIETALTEGQIKITKASKREKNGEYILNPGQVIAYQVNSDQLLLKEGDLDKHLAWRSGKFMFRNDPLEVVCRKLGRWFNAEIEIKDESLKSYAFTGTFQEEGLGEIIELISLTSPISYQMIKRKVNEENEYGTLKVIIMEK